MSNLETEPDELVCAEDAPSAAGIELLEPRNVPLGGPRAMEVRRTLPQRARSLIGAWCFVDHYGPDTVARTHGMRVPPHPHTGLQTVSWLFAGEIEHRDSTGAHAMVRPGELNLMTAGSGIQHSEVSTTDTTVLHGAQLWVALPDSDRHSPPFFEHYSPTPIEHDGATLRVFLGSLLGQTSTATAFSPLVGAQVDIPAHTTSHIPLAHLAYLAPGRTSLALTAGGKPVRALLIGGVPLGESIVMWWNFIGRSHEEIVEYRARWQAEMFGEAMPDTDSTDQFASGASQFGSVDGYDGGALPAPTLPNVRLRARD